MKERERQRRRVDEVQAFIYWYAQQHGPKGHEPNDRWASPEFARRLRRVDPAELDRLIRDEDDEPA